MEGGGGSGWCGGDGAEEGWSDGGGMVKVGWSGGGSSGVVMVERRWSKADSGGGVGDVKVERKERRRNVWTVE